MSFRVGLYIFESVLFGLGLCR